MHPAFTSGVYDGCVNSAPPISAERCEALLGRILAAPQFAKSPRLSAFLRFICELERQGLAGQINEQRIGVAVFGRKEGYSVGDDSIVRSQARFLRLHLEEYFAKEGSGEPMVLTIPKGSYVPFFQYRCDPAAALPPIEKPAPALPVPMPPTLRQRPFPLRFLWMALALLAVVALAVWFAPMLVRNRAEAQERAFWQSIFEARRTPIVVPSDSSLVLLEKLSERSIPLDDYINRRYLNQPGSPIDERTWRTIANSQYTSLADLNLVSRLEQRPEAINAKARVRFARSLSLKELKEDNIVLIGGSRANPWVDLFEPQMHMRVAYDEQTQQNLVWNHNPGPGEQERYFEQNAYADHAAYGVVAYLGSLDGQGSALLVGGTSKAGTEAAGDFLLSRDFAAFLHRLARTGVPPHFEVLLATDNINGESSNVRVVCFHRLN